MPIYTAWVLSSILLVACGLVTKVEVAFASSVVLLVSLDSHLPLALSHCDTLTPIVQPHRAIVASSSSPF